MNTKRTALAVAGAGVLAGVVGLGVLALPAGADEPPPVLPQISAEQLVESVANAKIPALAGKVSAQENLGLPIKLLDGIGSASVWADGQNRFRATLPNRTSEKTFVEDGGTAWIWDSAQNTVTKVPHGQQATPEKLAGKDPATIGKDLLGLVRQYSDVKVDGTARVATRPAYELVVTPKPTERTLLREIRVAVDSETRLPLRLQVLANGQADPALKVEFTELTVGPQDANLFKFTPPPGATVKERTDADKPHNPAEARKGMENFLSGLNVQFVGEGWDTTAVAKLPGDLNSMLGQVPGNGRGRGDMDVSSMLKSFAKEVSGPYGTGYVFSTKVATALVTTDGRVAIGAVPEQVLTEAIGQVK
ncbi:outer membrane lipoprotein carrier protein LolA [Kibdelosporangium aridum]|uniref:Outer membrane lipoprotein carrier protein LolA n=1 Tax=Kibdelosporangium aridum TaxID=2030 RepID=A0A428ZG06_KIBAR|nr:sigma-E factor regulatory protein RseB domain-containing protein [Kibdelosporangium aridum]RSM86996.1 outer membrane lipoprotein carrier protein LolA [Kibdelosporangium aridum]